MRVRKLMRVRKSEVRKVEDVKIYIREINRTYFNKYATFNPRFSIIETYIKGDLRIRIFKANISVFTKDITIGPYKEIDYLSRINQLEKTLKEGEYTKWMP